MAAAADEVSADAAAVEAAVQSSPLGGLEYFPTALLRDQLPVGLDDLGGVPTLAKTQAGSLALRIKKYALAIRRMAKVYATSEHKHKTKAQYDRVLLWLDAWSRLSGLGVTVTLSKRSGSLWKAQRLVTSVWKEKSDCVAWLGPSCLPGGATHGSRRERGVCPLVQTNEPSYGVVGSNSLCKPTGSSYAHCLHCCCQQCERRLG